MSEPSPSDPNRRTERMTIMLSRDELAMVRESARLHGFASAQDYLRWAIRPMQSARLSGPDVERAILISRGET